MGNLNRLFVFQAILSTAAALLLVPPGTLAQASVDQSKPASAAPSPTAANTSKADRWLHVRVVSSEAQGETVRVNVPLDLAEKVLPAINKDRLHAGKVRIDEDRLNDVDLHTILDAIRTTKDGEFVTVQKNHCDVRVAKSNNYLLVHVVDKGVHEKGEAKNTRVEVKVPMKVIDALLSAGKDELDLVAALHALSAQGDMELVSVKDQANTVNVWLDSKNVTD